MFRVLLPLALAGISVLGVAPQAAAQAAAQAGSAAPSVPVALSSRDGNLLSAALLVGWHTERYTIEYTNGHGRTVGYGFGYTSTPETVAVCAAPCATRLPASPIRLMIHDGGRGLLTDTFVPVAGATLELHTDRNDAARALGWTLFTVGLLGSAVGALTISLLEITSGMPRQLHDYFDQEHEQWGWLMTFASTALWLFVAPPLMALGDGAHVEVIPGGVRF